MITKLSRRGFLRGVAGIAGSASVLAGLPRARAAAAEGVGDGDRAQVQCMTVTGPMPIGDMGLTLPHEHVTTDFLGAEKLPAPRYDRDRAFEIILPHFQALRARGVRTLVECTPAHIGRDVRLLRRLSEAGGIRILTNTGYYGAVDNRYLPRHALTETADQLAARWLAEWKDGIEGTGIRPGFLKLGTGNGPLPEVHVTLLRAACRVHRETGLTVAVHSGDGAAARDEVRVLTEEKVSPEALVWVHAQNDPGPVQLELARRGAWVSLDGYSLAHRNPERYVNFLQALRREGLLHRVLLSHDDGWAVEGEAPAGSALKRFDNGNPEPYRSIFDRLKPDLTAAGFTDLEWRILTVDNPARAFGLRVRRA